MVTTTKRILILDEDRAGRDGLEKMLSSSAWLDVVTGANSGPEAITVAQQVQPDVIVVSVEEPAARVLRTIELLALALPESPVVAVSSLGDRESLRRAMLSGARDYLVKPLEAADVVAAIESVLRQEEKKRISLSESKVSFPRRGEVISVYGAKGGIGKTTLAVNLAASAALAGKKVALLDLDTQLGDVAVTLDIVPERTIADLAPVASKLDPEMIESFLTRHESGVRVLAAPLRPEDGDGVTAEHVGKIVEILAVTHDIVVVDYPRWFHDPVLAALDLSTTILLVTTTEVPSLKSSRLCLAAMRSWEYRQEKIKLVVNHATDLNGLSLAEVQDSLGCPVYWEVPFDPQVSTASRQGQVVVQARKDARISHSINELSVALGLVEQPQGSKGLFRRLRLR